VRAEYVGEWLADERDRSASLTVAGECSMGQKMNAEITVEMLPAFADA
jgi:hypothetical protein